MARITWGAAPSDEGWEGWVDIPLPGSPLAMTLRSNGRSRGDALARAVMGASDLAAADATMGFGFLASLIPDLINAVSSIAEGIATQVARGQRKDARREVSGLDPRIRPLAQCIVDDLSGDEAQELMGLDDVGNPYAAAFYGGQQMPAYPGAMPGGYGGGGYDPYSMYGQFPGGGYGGMPMPMDPYSMMMMQAQMMPAAYGPPMPGMMFPDPYGGMMPAMPPGMAPGMPGMCPPGYVMDAYGQCVPDPMMMPPAEPPRPPAVVVAPPRAYPGAGQGRPGRAPVGPAPVRPMAAPAYRR